MKAKPKLKWYMADLDIEGMFLADVVAALTAALAEYGPDAYLCSDESTISIGFQRLETEDEMHKRLAAARESKKRQANEQARESDFELHKAFHNQLRYAGLERLEKLAGASN